MRPGDTITLRDNAIWPQGYPSNAFARTLGCESGICASGSVTISASQPCDTSLTPDDVEECDAPAHA